MSKINRHPKPVLDLHHLRTYNGETIEEAVERILDDFLLPYLLKKTADITIIVGKGLGSKKFINGKNYLRYYTENYLQKIGCSWTSNDIYGQFDGQIKIRW
jgi:hypothetical protein